jgi:hypothetical protein
VSSAAWALVNAAMAGVDNVEIKAIASRTLSTMVLHGEWLSDQIVQPF